MVAAAVVMLTRESSAPGVHAGSGSPPWLTQPVVLVRAGGVHEPTTTGTGASVAGTSVGATLGEAGAHPVSNSTRARAGKGECFIGQVGVLWHAGAAGGNDRHR